jgi:hypothetical protein
LPQGEQRSSRSRPSAPEVQKNALGSSNVGRTRGTERGTWLVTARHRTETSNVAAAPVGREGPSLLLD